MQSNRRLVRRRAAASLKRRRSARSVRARRSPTGCGAPHELLRGIRWRILYRSQVHGRSVGSVNCCGEPRVGRGGPSHRGCRWGALPRSFSVKARRAESPRAPGPGVSDGRRPQPARMANKLCAKEADCARGDCVFSPGLSKWVGRAWVFSRVLTPLFLKQTVASYLP